MVHATVIDWFAFQMRYFSTGEVGALVTVEDRLKGWKILGNHNENEF